MKLEFLATEDLSDFQNKELDRLGEAVYPPGSSAIPPGSSFTWAAPQWSILLWDGDELVTHAGLLVREILQDGVVKRIGGIGGVATHPARQGQGFASQAMREAARLFDSELNVSFALLFCRQHLVEFYKRLLWKPFLGKIFVHQPHGNVEFSANGAMVLDVNEPAPIDGLLDLNGLPW